MKNQLALLLLLTLTGCDKMGQVLPGTASPPRVEQKLVLQFITEKIEDRMRENGISTDPVIGRWLRGAILPHNISELNISTKRPVSPAVSNVHLLFSWQNEEKLTGLFWGLMVEYVKDNQRAIVIYDHSLPIKPWIDLAMKQIEANAP